jgi:hypothetical protein
MMDNRERAELKAELELRVNRYLMAKAFAERVHAVWPLEFSEEVAEMGYVGATAYTNLKVFLVTDETPELEHTLGYAESVLGPVWIREMRNRPFKINRHYKNMTIKSKWRLRRGGVWVRAPFPPPGSWWWWTWW